MIKRVLLGTAFASADLIFEVVSDGQISFAAGSTKGIVAAKDGGLIGQNWRSVFSAADQNLLAALLRGVQNGERKGPMRMTLASEAVEQPGRPVMLSVFRLPEREGGPLSCALSYQVAGMGGDAATRSDDLIPSEDFAGVARRLMQEAEQSGMPLQVDLVQLDGLSGLKGGDDIRSRVVATLRANSLNGEGASEVGPDRYAVLRSAHGPADLKGYLEEITGTVLTPMLGSMQLGAGSVDQNLRALRYALDQYIGGGASAAAIDFGAVVQKTAEETTRLKSALASHSWQLVYQPVVSLKTEKVHHYEALARFEEGASPQGAIYLAEELGIIAELDLAVVRQVTKVLSESPPTVEIAVNLSASSLMRPGFCEALAEVTVQARRLRPRMLLEVTETQRLRDLNAANNAIQALRELGHSVCIDDFGAGAASIDYLRLLEVDYVKFDGRYIRTLTENSRDEVVLRHMVNLCKELKIQTIAEMIETDDVARLARTLGVELGQGWSFGKPQADLAYPQKEARPAAAPVRRRGAVDSWG